MLNEFMGINGFSRPAEGAMSWQHLTFVSSLVLVMAVLAFWLGNKNKKRSFQEKNRVLIVAALMIDIFELIKISINISTNNDPMAWTRELPLFLCSIQLITLPLAAFSKGRLKEAALDFVSIFGMLGAILGTYCATQNYNAYPVLSFPNVISGITHCISGFGSLYILISRMTSMKKENIPLTFSILLSFCVTAYVVNHLVDYNYMFLVKGDGTPYDILYNLIKGNPVLYPLGVVVLFLIYIVAFYAVFYLVTGKRKQKVTEAQAVR